MKTAHQLLIYGALLSLVFIGLIGALQPDVTQRYPLILLLPFVACGTVAFAVLDHKGVEMGRMSPGGCLLHITSLLGGLSGLFVLNGDWGAFLQPLTAGIMAGSAALVALGWWLLFQDLAAPPAARHAARRWLEVVLAVVVVAVVVVGLMEK